MTSSTRKHLLAVAAAAAVIGAPAAADAATFCVGPVDCPAGATSKGDDLQAALAAANTNVGTFDTILVADKGSPYVGPFRYSVERPAGSPSGPISVEVRGVGATRPRLTAATQVPVVRIAEGRLAGLDVVSTKGAGGIVHLADAAMIDVDVRDESAASFVSTGMFAAGAVTLDDVEISGPGQAGIELAGASDVHGTGVRISGGGRGIIAGEDTRLQLSRSRIGGISSAIAGSADTRIDRSTLTTNDAAAIAVQQLNGRLQLDHVTIADRAARTDADTIGIQALASTAAVARLHAVTIGGYGHGLMRAGFSGGRYDVEITDSVWSSANDLTTGGGEGTVTRSGGTVRPPVFVDRVGGDLRPAARAPQLDTDDLSAPDYRDLAGNAAEDADGDGNAQADAGALERVSAPPAPTAGDAPAAPATAPAAQSPAPAAVTRALAPAADRRAPRITRLRLTKGLRLTFRIDEAATLRIRVGRRTLIRRVKAGKRSIALRRVLRGRRIRLSVVATDAAGNRTAAKRLRRTSRR